MLNHAERFQNFLEINLDDGPHEGLSSRIGEIICEFGVLGVRESEEKELADVRLVAENAIGNGHLQRAFVILFHDLSMGALLSLKEDGDPVPIMTYCPLNQED